VGTEYDQAVFSVWFLGCLVFGPVLIAIRVHGAGFGLLGSVLGMFIGVSVVADNFDSLPYGAVCGATVGNIIAGAMALALTRSSRSVLSAKALYAVSAVTALLGAVTVAVISWMLRPDCVPRHVCLHAGGLSDFPLMFGLNAAIATSLLLIQALVSRRSSDLW
jgi:hypothetical protein